MGHQGPFNEFISQIILPAAQGPRDSLRRVGERVGLSTFLLVSARMVVTRGEKGHPPQRRIRTPKAIWPL